MLPNQCTCLCRGRFNIHECFAKGGDTAQGTNYFIFEGECQGAWQDPIWRHRNVLEVFETFGTRECFDGYEGHLNHMDKCVASESFTFTLPQLAFVCMSACVPACLSLSKTE